MVSAMSPDGSVRFGTLARYLTLTVLLSTQVYK